MSPAFDQLCLILFCTLLLLQRFRQVLRGASSRKPTASLLKRSAPADPQTRQLHVPLNLTTGRPSAIGVLAAEGPVGFGFGNWLVGFVYSLSESTSCLGQVMRRRHFSGFWFLNTIVASEDAVAHCKRPPNVAGTLAATCVHPLLAENTTVARNGYWPFCQMTGRPVDQARGM